MLKVTRPESINRRLKRYQQVVHVLVKHGFGQLVDQLRLWETTHLSRYLPKRHETQEFTPLTRPERARLALEELGPTYIKLGQLLSTRPDLIPPEYIAELEKLQAQVAPFSNEIARQTVQTELGRPLDEVFTSFGEQPVAAASLSQVYQAVLKSGQAVAVKVQRPGINEMIQEDLEIMGDLVYKLEQHFEEAREIELVALVEEFSADMKKELSFLTESSNLRRFSRNFGNDPSIHVPVVSPEFCTSRLLVMEFVKGINVSKVDQLKAEGYDLKLIAQRGADMYLKSILEDGFFHADPHPGNILVLPENVVCLLDFGMMGRLSSHDREILTGLLNSLVNYDAKGMTRGLLELSGAEALPEAGQLEGEISNLIDDYAYLPLQDLKLSEIFDQVIQVLRKYHLHLPKYYIWLMRVVSMVENFARLLDPDFNLAEYSRPYVQRLMLQRLNPKEQVRKFRYTASDFLQLLKDLPYESRNILRQLRAGQVKVEFEPVGVEPIRLTANRIFNRLVIAIIVAALLIGSAIIIHSGLPPLVSNIPVIGLAGFIIAALLGIWVIISVLRQGIT